MNPEEQWLKLVESGGAKDNDIDPNVVALYKAFKQSLENAKKTPDEQKEIMSRPGIGLFDPCMAQGVFWYRSYNPKPEQLPPSANVSQFRFMERVSHFSRFSWKGYTFQEPDKSMFSLFDSKNQKPDYECWSSLARVPDMSYLDDKDKGLRSQLLRCWLMWRKFKETENPILFGDIGGSAKENDKVYEPLVKLLRHRAVAKSEPLACRLLALCATPAPHLLWLDLLRAHDHHSHVPLELGLDGFRKTLKYYTRSPIAGDNEVERFIESCGLKHYLYSYRGRLLTKTDIESEADVIFFDNSLECEARMDEGDTILVPKDGVLSTNIKPNVWEPWLYYRKIRDVSSKGIDDNRKRLAETLGRKLCAFICAREDRSQISDSSVNTEGMVMVAFSREGDKIGDQRVYLAKEPQDPPEFFERDTKHVSNWEVADFAESSSFCYDILDGKVVRPKGSNGKRFEKLLKMNLQPCKSHPSEAVNDERKNVKALLEANYNPVVVSLSTGIATKFEKQNAMDTDNEVKIEFRKPAGQKTKKKKKDKN